VGCQLEKSTSSEPSERGMWLTPRLAALQKTWHI
jgi:hypothetical protein